jgi:hypothetical protein
MTFSLFGFLSYQRISKRFRVIGRGGWTGTRNYELDSGGYFMSMVWNYFQTPGRGAREPSAIQWFSTEFAQLSVVRGSGTHGISFAFQENNGHSPNVRGIWPP